MRQFLRFLMTSVPAGLCLAAPAYADPAAVEIREVGPVTELVIDSGDVQLSGFSRDQCGALLSLPLAAGLDVTNARTGGGRIRGVGLVDPQTLTVATDCGSVISVRRRRDQMVMTVSAPVQPARKPAADGQATAPPTPLIAAAEAPRAVAPSPVAAPGALLTEAEIDYARQAVADGVREAMKPSPPEPAKPPAAPRDPKVPDPGWGREAPLVELAAWRLAPFRPERDRLRKALAAAAPHDRGPIRDMLRFQLAWNLAAEAYATIEEISVSGEEQPLAAIAAILVNPADSRADWVLTNQSLRAADGPMWAATLLHRRGQGAEGARYLPAASRALGDLPPDLRREIGLDLLSVAAETGLDSMARSIARIIEPDASDPTALARLHYEIGRLHAAAGRRALALGQWDQAALLTDPTATRATIAAVAMRVAAGEATPDMLRQVLEAAVRDWPGTDLESDGLWRLAELAEARGDVRAGLEWLRLLNLRFPDRPPAEIAAQGDLAAKLLGALAGEKGKDVPLADRMLAFERNRELLPVESHGWAVRRQFAAMMAGAGASQVAEKELRALLAQVPADQRPAIRHDLAAMHLSAGDAAAALAALEDKAEGTEAEKRRAASLRGRALLMAGDIAGAMATIGDATDADSLAVRATGLWQQEKWADAAAAYQALAQARPLEAEEAARHALSGLLAGDPGAARVVEAHAATLAGQPWAGDLGILTRPVPGDKAGEGALRTLLEDSGALVRLVAPPARN